MDIYNSHLRGPARKMAIFDAEMANQANKLATMFEMVSLKSNQIYKDIETRVFLEGGDMDDMAYLYREAQEEAVEKKKGIITKIIEWFKKIFDAIREKVSGLINGSGENVDVEVPANVPKIVELLKKHFDAIKMALTKIKSGDFLGGFADLGKAVLPEIAIVTTAVVVVKHKAIIGWIKDLTGITKKSKDVIDGVESAVDKEESEDGVNSAEKSLNLFQKFIQKVSEIMSTLVELAAKGLDKAKAGLKKAGKTIADNADKAVHALPGGIGDKLDAAKEKRDWKQYVRNQKFNADYDLKHESTDYDFLDDDDYSFFY